MNITLRTLVALSILLAACQDDATQPVGRQRLSAVPEALVQRPIGTADRAFADLGELIPGFGGFYFDEAGGLHAYVGVTADAEKARAILQPFTSQFRGRDGSRGNGRIYLHESQFAFTDLLLWRDLANQLLHRGALVYTDVDERSNTLALGVEDISAAAWVKAWLSTRGVPPGAIDLRGAILQPMATLRDVIRPVFGGLLIGGSGSCTMGFLVEYDGVRAYTTNSHCTTTPWGPDGGTYYQWTIGNRIGVEISDPTQTTISPYCPSPYTYCRWSDSAILELDDSVSWDFGKIGRTETASQDSTSFTLWSLAPTRQIVGVVGLMTEVDWAGTTIYKTGQRSGTTFGVATNTCLDLIYGSNNLLMCQVVVRADVRPGDSGSPVWRATFPYTGIEAMGLAHYRIQNVAMDTTWFVYSPMSGIMWDHYNGGKTFVWY